MATLANGDWVPDDHPLANSKPAQTQIGTADPNAGSRTIAGPQVNQTVVDPADPFQGRGVKLANGDWVPNDHPLAQQQGGAGGGTTAPGAAPGAPAATNIGQQAQNAATYSATPGAAPTQNTTNQGTQDVVRNSYLQQATQGTKVDTTDPNFRQQADTFAAGVERSRRNFLSDQAESAGPYATGAMRGQERMAAERAGQASGGFEAELVGRELQNKRAEIQNALQQLGGMVNSDQGRALQQQLAEMQAAIQRHSIDTGAATANADLSLRDRLAQMQNQFNYAQLGQQDRQFADTLGFNIGDREAYWNNAALQNLFA